MEKFFVSDQNAEGLITLYIEDHAFFLSHDEADRLAFHLNTVLQEAERAAGRG